MKKKAFLTYSFIILAIGLLIGFYFVVYKPFESRKSFIYIKSDFSLAENHFSELEESLQIVLTDNTKINNNELLYKVEYVRLESVSNSEYIDRTGNSNTEIGILLLSYYDNVKLVAEQIRPKIIFNEFAFELNEISNGVETKINSTDNYDDISTYIETVLGRIGRIENNLDDTLISNYPELEEIATEYIADIKSYYTEMLPLVRSVPSYLAQNDRDKTREIMAKIDALSAQFKGNEANLDQLAREYFQATDASISNAMVLLNSLESEIAYKLSILSI